MCIYICMYIYIARAMHTTLRLKPRDPECTSKPYTPIHPGDSIEANGTSQKWTCPGMPPDSGGILRGCPLLGGAICPDGISPGWL